MNKELSNVLKGKLAGLPFVDLLCGMVQTVTRDNMIDDTAGKVTKKFPVTYDHNDDECKGREIMVIPTTSKKSILYFEDFGVAVTDKRHGMSKYQSSLRLVCWLNRSELVGDQYADISGRCISAIVDTLAGRNPENIGIFTTLTVKVARIPPQDIGLFGRYTYNEQDRQVLRPPFEFFGIDLVCDYFVSSKCLNQIQWNQQTCY